MLDFQRVASGKPTVCYGNLPKKSCICLLKMVLLKQESEAFMKWYSTMSQTMGAQEEKLKESESHRKASVLKMASEYIAGTVAHDVEIDTYNQNLVRGGIGRFHTMTLDAMSERLPCLLQSMLRRMAAEEGIPTDSIAVLLVADFGPTTGPSADALRDLQRLFKHLPNTKLMFHVLFVYVYQRVYCGVAQN